MADAQEKFDIDDPVLPKWVKKGALGSGAWAPALTWARAIGA